MLGNGQRRTDPILDSGSDAQAALATEWNTDLPVQESIRSLSFFS